MCVCDPGYIGERCGENIDECRSQPCSNGGECQDKVNGYTCGCLAGYTGETCKLGKP